MSPVFLFKNGLYIGMDNISCITFSKQTNSHWGTVHMRWAGPARWAGSLRWFLYHVHMESSISLQSKSLFYYHWKKIVLITFVSICYNKLRRKAMRNKLRQKLVHSCRKKCFYIIYLTSKKKSKLIKEKSILP